LHEVYLLEAAMLQLHTATAMEHLQRRSGSWLSYRGSDNTCNDEGNTCTGEINNSESNKVNIDCLKGGRLMFLFTGEEHLQRRKK